MSTIQLNHGDDPAKKPVMAAAIRGMLGSEIMQIMAKESMLDVQGYDENGIARSSDDYYERLATAIVDWIKSTDPTLAAFMLAKQILPEVEASPHWRQQHLRSDEGKAAIRNWRRKHAH